MDIRLESTEWETFTRQTFQRPFKSKTLFEKYTLISIFYLPQYLQPELHTVDKQRKDAEEYRLLFKSVVCLQTRLQGRTIHITEFLIIFFFLTKNTPMLVIEKCNPLCSFLSTVCLCQKSAALRKSLVTTLTQKLAVMTASLPLSGLPHTCTHLYGQRDQEGEKNEILQLLVHTSLSLDKSFFPRSLLHITLF